MAASLPWRRDTDPHALTALDDPFPTVSGLADLIFLRRSTFEVRGFFRPHQRPHSGLLSRHMPGRAGLLVMTLAVGLVLRAAQGPSPSAAQGADQRPPITFRSEVNFVEIDAIVTDRDGRFVATRHRCATRRAAKCSRPRPRTTAPIWRRLRGIGPARRLRAPRLDPGRPAGRRPLRVPDPGQAVAGRHGGDPRGAVRGRVTGRQQPLTSTCPSDTSTPRVFYFN